MTSSVQQGTVAAFGLIVKAVSGVVADAGERPHVMHRPHNGLPGGEDLFEVLHRQHALVDPVQVDHIGLLEFGKSRNVGSRIGNVHSKEMILFKPVGLPDADTFPHKFPHQPPAMFQRHHGDAVRLFVTHQHFGLDAIVFERFHQSAASDGRASNPFGCIDQYYSHEDEQAM